TAFEGKVLLERPEPENDAGQAKRYERGLDRGGARRRHERRKERREGAREMTRGLAPPAPDHALEPESSEEPEDRRGQAHRPFHRAKDTHHERENPREEDRCA